MKRSFQALTVAALVFGLLATFLFAGCGQKSIAKINGNPVTQEDFMRALETGVGLDTGPSTGKRVLDTLITQKLVEKEAQEKGVKVTDKEIEEAVKQAEQSIAGRYGSIDDYLKRSGLTRDYLRDSVKLNLTVQKLVVTDQEAEQFFSEHSNDFNEPEMITFYQMFLPTKAAAESARKEVVDGKKDFATVAKAKGMQSQAAMPVPPSGIPVTIPKGPIEDPDPGFADLLFSMKQGEISQPRPVIISIPTGTREAPKMQQQTVYRVLYVAERKPPKTATLQNSLEEARRRAFSNKIGNGELRSYLNNLKAKARIEIEDPDYSSLEEEYKSYSKEMPEPAPQGMTPNENPPGVTAPQPPAPQAPPAGQ